jgi:hypothetical protein
VSDDGAPKSAYELAMERLKAKDREEGVEERPITDEQKARIAEVRSQYEARFAEREILHRDALRKTRDPGERETLEEEYRRDRERLGTERDRKIREIREQE